MLLILTHVDNQTEEDCHVDWNGTRIARGSLGSSLILQKYNVGNEFYSGVELPNEDNATFGLLNRNASFVDVAHHPYPTFDLRAQIFVMIYCCVFVIAVIGNVTVFANLFKSRKRKSRISLLIIHLTIADLIVTFIMLPFEIAWRVTIQWMGGHASCKILMFFRAFGLYLSSNILICISLDRYFAVVYPLMATKKRNRGKMMLWTAWTASIIYALPQMFIFHVDTHPHFVNFTQCVSFGFFTSAAQELIYNIACLMGMYFIPLGVIITTYGSILWEMWLKANNLDDVSANPSSTSNAKGLVKRSNACTHHYHHHPPHQQQYQLQPMGDSEYGTLKRNNNNKASWSMNDTSATIIKAHTTTAITTKHRDAVILRRSDMKCIERARIRTLKMTIVIVIAFLICWTPYVVMTLWYMLDRQSAESVPKWIQDALFMMAVSNSCMNPIVYGRFTVRTLVTAGNSHQQQHQRRQAKNSLLCCCCTPQTTNFSRDQSKSLVIDRNIPLYTGRRQYARRKHPAHEASMENVSDINNILALCDNDELVESMIGMNKQCNYRQQEVHSRRLDYMLLRQTTRPRASCSEENTATDVTKDKARSKEQQIKRTPAKHVEYIVHYKRNSSSDKDLVHWQSAPEATIAEETTPEFSYHDSVATSRLDRQVVSIQ